MRISKTLYVTTRLEWRRWLAKHHRTEKDIWLIYYRKDSRKPRISYNDAVEEALCYGWIDSTVKSMDAQRFAQRFSPRKSTSALSQPNIERLHKLITAKKMTKAGLAAVAHAFAPAKKSAKFSIASDVLRALKANATAWKNFQRLPASYKRVRIAFIESRRRHGAQAFRKSLQNFITKTAKNQRFGLVKELQ